MGPGQQENSMVFLGKCIQHLLSSPHCWVGRGTTVFFSLCALPTALLHPGDKVIREGEDTRQIRQPGGSYTKACDPAPSPVSTSRSRTASGKQAKEAENRFVERGFRISSCCCVTPLCSVPTTSEVIPRCWSETSGCCKGAASDSEEAESPLGCTAASVFQGNHWVAVVLVSGL